MMTEAKFQSLVGADCASLVREGERASDHDHPAPNAAGIRAAAEHDKPKHTPGPWVVDGEDHYEPTGALEYVYVAQVWLPENNKEHPRYGKAGGRICKTFVNCLVDDEGCRANARAIAALPALLTALRSSQAIAARFIERHDESEEPTLADWQELARAEEAAREIVEGVDQ